MPARALVLLAHADPSVRAKFEREFAARDLDVDLTFVNRFVPKKLSSAYGELAAQLKRGGRILPQLRAKFPPAHEWEGYAVRIAASFSAGFKLWEHVLAISADVADLDGIVGIDSFHAGIDPDCTASDRQLAGLVSFALSAKEGPRVCWIGHTDVATSGYASTTLVAEEIVRLAGGTGGGFLVDGYDLTKVQEREHGLALTEWGPRFLADAVLEALWRRSGHVASSPPALVPQSPPDYPLGVAAVRWARAELARGAGESPPGSNGGPDVARYFSGCVRGELAPGWIKAGEWCAAGACAAAFFSLRPGQRVPHRWRASVLELWQDACSAEFGSARSAEAVRAGRYVPQEGDLVIRTRGGGAAVHGGTPAGAFARTGGKGHVGRVLSSPDAAGKFRSIDANHGASWGEVTYSVLDPELVGFVSYAGEIIAPSDFEIAQLARLSKLSADVWEQRGIGIEAIDRVLELEA